MTGWGRASSDEAASHDGEVSPQGPSRTAGSEVNTLKTAQLPLVTERPARILKSKSPGRQGASMKMPPTEPTVQGKDRADTRWTPSHATGPRGVLSGTRMEVQGETATSPVVSE